MVAFAEAELTLGKLGLRLDSIENRHPPEPDLSAISRAGERVYFELTRIQDAGSARIYASGLRLKDELEYLLGTYKSGCDRNVWVKFHDDCSTTTALKHLPTLADLILSTAPTEILNLSRPVQLPLSLSAVVDKLLVHDGWGDVYVSSFHCYQDPIGDRLKVKFGKTYEVQDPIELVCYYFLQSSGTYELLDRYKLDVQHVIREGLLDSCYRRVWIFDSGQSRIIDVFES